MFAAVDQEQVNVEPIIVLDTETLFSKTLTYSSLIYLEIFYFKIDSNIQNLNYNKKQGEKENLILYIYIYSSLISGAASPRVN
jgi:hypothetical protein